MTILRTENLTKVYPGTVALDNASVAFESGKVNAVIGKNGSGKSTLIKIISGAVRATSGAAYLDDVMLDFQTPEDAAERGIATVYQELSLVPSLSVAENIYMGRLPMKRGLVDWKTMYAMADRLLESMNINLSSRTPVAKLAMWQRQMVEIVKGMSHNPRVLMLDEPTSALAQHESDLLFGFIREIKAKDVVILYISHRLHELWEIADNCTVLRDGRFIGKLDMADVTREKMIDMMFGDVAVRSRPPDLVVGDEVVLRVENLTREGKFRDVSFDLRKGEILGIAGMLGSGRTELLKSIFGADPITSGRILVHGAAVKRPDPRIMKRHGLAMTQEDRKNAGLIQRLSVFSNLCVASLDRLSNRGLMNRKLEKTAVRRQIADLDIAVPSPGALVSSLSGGNQQKVVVGNWLNNYPDIMLLDEPSRGIDVNAKQQIFQIVWDESRKGISFIMVSSELEELIEVCQRILIMRGGEIREEANADDISIQALYAKCMEVDEHGE